MAEITDTTADQITVTMSKQEYSVLETMLNFHCGDDDEIWKSMGLLDAFDSLFNSVEDAKVD